ncbi:MAG: hypothetical protein IKJ14_04450 [Clostridia bacterium]|nr:hypothetical protein [Clostridia bacterium]
MKKLFKKLLVLTLASTVALATVGCGDKGKNNADDKPSGPNVSVLQPLEPTITMASAIPMLLGETKNLNVQTKNVKGDLVYDSSDKSVAIVENGNITAVGAGISTVTASFGGVTASCVVSVSYGDYLPTLRFDSNLVDNTIIAVDKTYDILPYVDFNGLHFDDFDVDYVIEDDSVLTISEDGVITTLKTGATKVTINANWRDFTFSDSVQGKTQSDTLSATFNLEVKDNVAFYDEGQILTSYAIETPASFIDPASYNNVHVFVPTAIVNGETIPLPTENISVKPVGNTEAGVDYTYDATTMTLTALQMGEVVVEFSYNDYKSNFVITIDRPIKTLATGVELFSANSGLYKIKTATGYQNVALETFADAWGEDVTLVDAYQDGLALTVNNANGAVLGLQVNQEEEINTSIVLGTKTERYEIPVKACAGYMADAQDVKLSFEQVTNKRLITGYHKLLNDIDMTGVVIDNRVDDVDNFGVNLYAGYRKYNGVVYYEDINSRPEIGFAGVFDGCGYTIKNATVVQANDKGAVYSNPECTIVSKYANIRAYGFFHNVKANGVIKNVAFTNLFGEKLVGDQNKLYGLVSPLSYSFNGTMQNVYVDVNENNSTTRGILANIGAAAVIDNVIVEFKRPEDYKFAANIEKYLSEELYAYGYSSFSTSINAAAKLSDIVVVSPVPLSLNGGPSGLKDDASASNAITYGANETKLLFPFSAFDTVHPKNVGNHTVQSTAGPHEEISGQVVVTGKTIVNKNILRYNNMAEFTTSDYEGLPSVAASFATSENWYVIGNTPIWHSLTDNYADQVYATLNDSAELTIDCYETAGFDVKLFGGSVEELTIASNSDLISIENNAITGVKLGDGAVVNASYKINGKSYTKAFTVNVVSPFNFSLNGEEFDNEVEFAKGSTGEFKVMLKGVEVPNVTFASSSSNLVFNGSSATASAFANDVVVTATFVYEGTNWSVDFVVDVIDIISKYATVKVNGVATEEVVLKISETPYTIGVESNGTDATSVTLSSDSAAIIVSNDKLTANLFGEALVTINFTVDGVAHEKVITVTIERDVENTVIINDAVDFDANKGFINSTLIDDSGIVEAIVKFEGKTFTLNKENGGILANGEMRIKSSKADEEAGLPIISKREYADVQKFSVTIGTNKAYYQFNDVSFWTSIIDNANALKAALDIDYSKQTHNYGFYKLSGDIDMTGITFAYNSIKTPVPNQNGNGGFLGYFDGYGYTIKNYNVGEYGLFGAFLYNGGTLSVGGAVVKNIAFTNVTATDSGNTGKYALLGWYTPDHNYWPGSHLHVSNLYVSFNDESKVQGIIGFNGFGYYNNIVIDTAGNTVATGSTLAGDEYGAEVSGKAIAMNSSMYSDSTALFQNNRLNQPERATAKYINNVITLGATPVVYQWCYGSNYNSFWHYENGVLQIRNIGTLQPYTSYETYVGFAGNQVKGDIPIMTGMKAGFKALVDASTITADSYKAPNNVIAGYVCTTCGETFSKTEGTCATCNVALTKFDDLWKTPWSFTWTLTDIATHVNVAENSVYKSGTYVYEGVSKYNTIDEMKSSNNDFASFVGAEGNGLWTVTEGVLTWVGAKKA